MSMHVYTLRSVYVNGTCAKGNSELTSPNHFPMGLTLKVLSGYHGGSAAALRIVDLLRVNHHILRALAADLPGTIG